MRPILWFATFSILPLPVAAQELACSGRSSGMGCFDAAPLPGPAEPSPFRWLGRGRVLDFGHVAGTALVRYASAPAELIAAGSDPRGRLVPIVRYTSRLDLRLAVGLGRAVDVTLTQPFALSQAGSGPDALLTQSPPPLASRGMGDPRLAFRRQLPENWRDFDWIMRLEFTIPWGNERAYLGERDMTEAVAINAHWTRFGLSVASDLGLQMSRPTRFGDVTLGTHAFWGLGLDYAPFKGDLIHFSIEGLVRPNLVTSIASPSPNTDRNNSAQAQPANFVMPTEWLMSVSTQPLQSALWFTIGGGMAAALSHRQVEDPRADARFVTPSTPRFQLLAAIAYRN